VGTASFYQLQVVASEGNAAQSTQAARGRKPAAQPMYEHRQTRIQFFARNFGLNDVAQW
jgi:hypothetical protein